MNEIFSDMLANDAVMTKASGFISEMLKRPGLSGLFTPLSSPPFFVVEVDGLVHYAGHVTYGDSFRRACDGDVCPPSNGDLTRQVTCLRCAGLAL